MKRKVCNSCLKECEDSFCYSCRKILFHGRKVSHVLEFAFAEFNARILQSGSRISISGVQLKHLLKLERNKLHLTDAGGAYILKPVPHGTFLHLAQLPANEHVTMQIAEQVFGIETAPNAYVQFADNKPAYLTRRFDISPSGKRFLVEDFAQIAQKTEESDGYDYKYRFSYEEIGELIKQYVSASIIETEKFFRLVLFNYIISNGDAHLKNFSLYRNEEYGDYLLTPAYDLLCMKLHVPNESDTALELFADGYMSQNYKHSSKYAKEDFIEFGRRLGMKKERVEAAITGFLTKERQVARLLDWSFLNNEMKAAYIEYFRNKCQLIE